MFILMLSKARVPNVGSVTYSQRDGKSTSAFVLVVIVMNYELL